jgi:TonB family protein
MLRTILIFIFGLLLLQAAKAQKLDTVLVNMKNNGRMVKTSDSADYILLVITPADSSTGVKINEVQEFYIDHKRKLAGTAIIYVSGDVLFLKFVGPRIDYFQNGRKKSITNYKNGIPQGDATLYYPNGKLYAMEKYNSKNELLLLTCHDSTGNSLAENGDGKWLDFDVDFKHKVGDGVIKDSLREGEWHEIVNDSVKYMMIYKHGVAVSSTDPNWLTQIFSAVEKEPQFKSGPGGFNAYLAKAVKFPDFDRQNGTQGRVIVTFVVEKDGTLSNVKALRGPDQSMMDAAVQAIQQSPPWLPGMQGGRPVRVQYTISFAFSLANN